MPLATYILIIMLCSYYIVCGSLSLEERVTRLETEIAYIRGVLEQMDRRLNHIESEVSGLRSELSGLRSELSGLRSEVDKRFESLFRWVVGLILGMWASVMLTLIPMLLKLLGAI